MVSTSTRIVAVSVAVAACLTRVNGHGYMLIPESQFDGSANSAWIVQIEPQWSSDSWNGNSQESVDTYVSLKEENGLSNIRSLLDDTSIYGADCGYTNPDGTAQDIPTDSTATFSRGMVHVGPCEIWLDDTMVLSEDDCYSLYGGDDQDVKSVFPVDYSSCDSGGCSEMRFYWLAFQGVDDETVWQVYKDCIPLTGSSSSTSTTTTSSTETESDADTATTTTTSSTTSSADSESTTTASTPSSDSTTTTTSSSTGSTGGYSTSTTESSSATTTSGGSFGGQSTSTTTASSGTTTSGSSFGGGNTGGSTQSGEMGGNGGNGGNGGGWSGGFTRHLKH